MSESGFTFDLSLVSLVCWAGFTIEIRRQETCSVTDGWKTINNYKWFFYLWLFPCYHSSVCVQCLFIHTISRCTKFLWSENLEVSVTYKLRITQQLLSWEFMADVVFFKLSNEWIPCCKVNATHMVASLVTTVCRLLGDGALEVVLDQCPCVKRFQPFPYEWGWHHKKLRLQ